MDAPLFVDRLNSALERIYNSGKWKGLVTTVSFTNTPGGNWFPDEDVQYVTLPRQYQAILGIQFAASGLPGIPRQVYPRWQEYIAGGGGELSPGTSMQMAVDIGDGHPVAVDPTLPFYIEFQTIDPDDVTTTFQVAGIDSDGNSVFDEYGNAWLNVTANSVYTGVLWSRITEIKKPVTQGDVNLLAISQDQTGTSLISTYEATETVPQYKRYRLGGSQFAAQFNCLCKRRFVELVNGPDDDTVIIPSNEGALKLTLMALQYEDKNDMERAEEYFNKAIQLLNAELKEDMGDPVITLQMNPLGAAMRIPARY